MDPQPYAPYAPWPFNLLRDWLHRRRNWVRLGLAIVLGLWPGPRVYHRLLIS